MASPLCCDDVLLGVAAACTAPAPAASPSPAAAPQPTALPRSGSDKDLILATTTSTPDSGLLDVLVPMFEQQTGYNVKTVAVATERLLVMHDDFVVIGPPKTPLTSRAKRQRWMP